MSTYNGNIFVTISPYFNHIEEINAKDIFVVDSCENIAGRTHTILFCSNVVTGKKRELSADVIHNVSTELVKSLLEREVETIKDHMANMTKILGTFQEIPD